MLIKDIMTKDCVTLGSDDTVQKAAQLMKQHDVGAIPVCNQNKVVGIVTDRDITLRAVATDNNDAQQSKMCDVMTSDPIVGRPDMSVNDAAKIMSEKQVRRLPIVENDNLVGIVALGDISLENATQDSANKALKEISKE